MRPGPEREKAKAADTRADQPISEHREPREVMLGDKKALHARKYYFYRDDTERQLQRLLALARRQPLPGNLTYEIRGTTIIGIGREREYEIGDLNTSPRIWGCYAQAAGETEHILWRQHVQPE
ncbi:MAG: hypothetical protein GXX96_04040 [Planctomycetaceae bacterium]|nr:hypothetical protein [Planctomycetaceae bacterium]